MIKYNPIGNERMKTEKKTSKPGPQDDNVNGELFPRSVKLYSLLSSSPVGSFQPVFALDGGAGPGAVVGANVVAAGVIVVAGGANVVGPGGGTNVVAVDVAVFLTDSATMYPVSKATVESVSA